MGNIRLEVAFVILLSVMGCKSTADTQRSSTDGETLKTSTGWRAAAGQDDQDRAVQNTFASPAAPQRPADAAESRWLTHPAARAAGRGDAAAIERLRLEYREWASADGTLESQIVKLSELRSKLAAERDRVTLRSDAYQRFEGALIGLERPSTRNDRTHWLTPRSTSANA